MKTQIHKCQPAACLAWLNLMVLGLLILSGAPAKGALVVWTGGGGNDSWHDAANWSNNVLPSATSDVIIGIPKGT